MKKLYFILFTIILAISCQTSKDLPIFKENLSWKTKEIPATEQIMTGNSIAGFKYLTEGDYIGSGTPYQLIKNKMQKRPDTILARNGDNEYAFYWGNVFKTNNGVKVFAGNCFTCHSATLNEKVILGLGNTNSQYQENKSLPTKLLRLFVKTKYKKNGDTRTAFQPYSNSIKVLSPYILTNNGIVNPAFRLEEACTIFRNPIDLKHEKKANFKPISYTFASDVPPLWNLKKKNALYYNSMGRGSMTKLLMQASVIGIPDSSSARLVHENFDDVLAWIKTINPPSYPKEIDAEKMQKGKVVFEKNCSNCHGTYGEKSTYPNKLIALHIVKTDPLYALYFTQKSHLVDWYNRSWYANSNPKSSLIPEEGYIAPPLDGIWASAPYLHNGSVPTLNDLLNSQQRPTLWQKNQSKNNYDYENLGWKYQIATKAKGKNWYNSNLPGYGNNGHTFGDKLNNDERIALIEYLKSL